MQTFDFIVLALLLFAAVWGARRGFVKQLASLLSIVLGYVVAINLRQTIAPLIDAPHPWNNFAAMLGLFIATSLVIWIAFRFVNGTIEQVGLTAFDTQMGGLFGLAKGLVIAVVLTMFSVVLLGDSQRDAVLGSFSGSKICQLIYHSQQFVPAEWEQTMRPYLETVHEHAAEVVELPPNPEQFLEDDPFASDSPNDNPAFSDTLNVGPSFDELQQGQYGESESSRPYPQARLKTPVFDR